MKAFAMARIADRERTSGFAGAGCRRGTQILSFRSDRKKLVQILCRCDWERGFASSSMTKKDLTLAPQYTPPQEKHIDSG